MYSVSFIEVGSEHASVWSTETVTAPSFAAALKWANDYAKALNKSARKEAFEVCSVSFLNTVFVI